MRLITIKVSEDNERNTIEAKLECDPNDGASELEAFTGDRIMKGINFVLNAGVLMPPAIAVGTGPLCDEQTAIQLDIAKAGRRAE